MEEQASGIRQMAGRRRTSSSGRSFKERMKAAVTDNPWNRAVIKATDSSKDRPKSKHVKVLVDCTFNPSIPSSDIAEGLFRRAQSAISWHVALKALSVMHKLLRDGHEKFGHYLATRSSQLQMDRFMDLKSGEGPPMSVFVRQYARYLNKKMNVIRRHGLDFAHAKAPATFEYLKTEKGPKLLATVEDAQDVIGELVATVRAARGRAPPGSSPGIDVPPSQLTEEEIMHIPPLRGALSLLVNDSLGLFVRVNDAMVNVLERYFKMSKTQAATVLALYETFARQCMDIDDIIDLAKRHGILDGRHLPTLAEAPSSVLPALRQHLQGGAADATAAYSKSTAAATHTAISRFGQQAQAATSVGLGLRDAAFDNSEA